MSDRHLAELMAFFTAERQAFRKELRENAASTKPHSGCIQGVTQPETSHAKKEEAPNGKRGRY